MKATKIKPRLELYEGVEQRYRAPFPVVNAAVYELLSVCLDGQDIHHAQSPGITEYTITLPGSNLRVRIHVTQLAEGITALRVRPYLWPGQTIDDVLDNPHVVAFLKPFYWMCQEYILQSLRYTYPELTSREIKGITPPMPTPDKGLRDLIAWKDRWLRSVSDQEFAEQIGASEQSLRNARCKLERPKVPRGRARGKN